MKSKRFTARPWEKFVADGKLKGLSVVYFESRLAKTIGDLIALQGGNGFSAKAMKEAPIEKNADTFAFAEKLLQGNIDILILLTGVGTKTLLSVLDTRYEREKIVEALKKTKIVPRGPKPERVLKELGVPWEFSVPEPNTWRELVNALDEKRSVLPVDGRVVAVQEYGASNPGLLEALKERGAKTLVLRVYRWTLPDDIGPLKAAVKGLLEAQFQVALFTTSVQVDHLLQVADTMGVAEAVKTSLKRIAVASVGPDCSETLRFHGIEPDIQPQSPKMGALVLETADKARQVLEKKK